MNEWSLLEVEALKDHPGHYFAQFFGDGEVELVVGITLRRDENEQTRIVYTSVSHAPTAEKRPGLSPGTLRAIPYGQLTAMAEPYIHDLAQSDSYSITAPTEPDVMRELFDFDALRSEWPKGDLHKVSNAVAEVYVSAIGFGEPPKPAVAEAFKTSLTTAGRMITKARELGILNVSSVGGRPKAKGTHNGKKETTDR